MKLDKGCPYCGKKVTLENYYTARCTKCGTKFSQTGMISCTILEGPIESGFWVPMDDYHVALEDLNKEFPGVARA